MYSTRKKEKTGIGLFSLIKENNMKYAELTKDDFT
jgi:hypothetical protein